MLYQNNDIVPYFSEVIWSYIKGRVARRNTANSQSLNGIWKLTIEEMEKISVEDWESAIRKAISWEDKYALLDGIDKKEEVPEPVDTEVLEVQEPPSDELQEPQLKCTGTLFFLFNSIQYLAYLSFQGCLPVFNKDPVCD